MRVIGLARVVLAGLVVLATGLWLIGLPLERAVGGSMVAGVLVFAVWAVLFIDWAPPKPDDSVTEAADGQPG